MFDNISTADWIAILVLFGIFAAVALFVIIALANSLRRPSIFPIEKKPSKRELAKLATQQEREQKVRERQQQTFERLKAEKKSIYMRDITSPLHTNVRDTFERHRALQEPDLPKDPSIVDLKEFKERRGENRSE